MLVIDDLPGSWKGCENVQKPTQVKGGSSPLKRIKWAGFYHKIIPHMFHSPALVFILFYLEYVMSKSDILPQEILQFSMCISEKS